MPTPQLQDWLRLWHVPGIGPRIFLRLLERFNRDPGKILQADYSALIEAGAPKSIAKAIGQHSTTSHHTDFQWLDASEQHHIFTLNDPNYPLLLREISDPPPILYVQGNPAVWSDRPCLAMVGSRKATSLGKQNAFHLARALSAQGITIVSGLANGIDGQAHRGALASKGSTLAIMGNGLQRIYPTNHTALAREICVDGALISEFSPTTKPLPQHFPQRNRIISGLSLGTIIVEAATKSGSLITAYYALEQNREVFALPGPLNCHQSAGCHTLIQQGAKLVTKAEDILLEFATFYSGAKVEPIEPKPLPKAAKRAEQLLNVLEYTPMPMDLLIEKSGLTADQVSSMLTELEVSGHVVCDTYGLYARSASE